jgi:hypothetical protein
MTWEQKEVVLRRLFSRMNSPREPRAFRIEVVQKRVGGISGADALGGPDPTARTPAIEGLRGVVTAESPSASSQERDLSAFFITEGALEEFGTA